MFVSAPSLVCSVGLDAQSAFAAMRAGISQFEELPYCIKDGEPIVGAVVPGLDSEFHRPERQLELLAMAVSQSIDALPQGARPEEIPLLVCLSEPNRPGAIGAFARSIIGALERKLKISFHPERSGAIAKGHTAGFRAMRAARRLLQDREIPACLVCGVDSFLNARSLQWLNRQWRLKTEENSDGVIPGEAAAAVLVTRTPVGSTQAGTRVTGLGFAREEATISSDEPMLGLGLTDAVRCALAEARHQIHEFDFRISDVAGESYAFRELSLALSRLIRVRREDYPIWHAADSVGDVGAASGILQLSLAENAFTKGYAPGRRVLCHSAAVNGDRAAAAIEFQAA